MKKHLPKSQLKSLGVVVLRLCCHKVVIKEIVESLKGGSLLRPFVPTFLHDVIERVWTVCWLSHAVTGLHFLQGCLVVHAYVKARRENKTNSIRKPIANPIGKPLQIPLENLMEKKRN